MWFFTCETTQITHVHYRTASGIKLCLSVQAVGAQAQQAAEQAYLLPQVRKRTKLYLVNGVQHHYVSQIHLIFFKSLLFFPVPKPSGISWEEPWVLYFLTSILTLSGKINAVESGEAMTIHVSALDWAELSCKLSCKLNQFHILESVALFAMSLRIPPGCHFMELPFQKGTHFQQFLCHICQILEEVSDVQGHFKEYQVTVCRELDLHWP